MRPGPVARAVRGGLTRRRVQTVVIALVLLVSVGASVLALALVVDSRSPFDHAFAAQRGAHAVVTVDQTRATSAQLAATGRLPQVTAFAGPYPEVTVTPRDTGPDGGLAVMPSLTLAGRASPGGPLDDLTLRAGHWARRTGQVVLATDPNPGSDVEVPLGTKIAVTGVPGRPVLTVVGLAASINSSAAGWVLPAEIGRLRAPDAPASAQLLFRFASAGSAGAMSADMRAVGSALPAGTVTGSQSYLTVRDREASSIGPFVPFLVAFGVIGLVMSVLIVANVVSGAVVAGYRRIGILKSIGFTPGQVVAAYTSQATAPAVAGCLGGLVLGNVLAAPLLHQASGVYGVGSLGVPVWVDIVVPVAMCCLVGIAALLPALRAGRFSAVQAIALGRAPRTGRGFAAHRLLGRVPLPRPVTIGLAAPFARPARTVVTLAAILLGATAVTFAVGLSSSLNGVVAALSHDSSEPVRVEVPSNVHGFKIRHIGPNGAAPAPHVPPPAVLERTVTTALRAQPGTLHYVAETTLPASVPGLPHEVDVTGFRGNSGWTGYELISGRWYSRPGQVDVPTGFLTASGKSVGDTVTLVMHGGQVPVRIVGEVFDTRNDGVAMFTSWQTVAAAAPGVGPDQYDVQLRPGTPEDAYVRALGRALGHSYFVDVNNSRSDTLTLMLGLVGTLTLLLALVAGLGVLNTIVLYTRERVHDLGVFKAVGMTPRQAVAMVVCWVAGTGLVAGLIAVPAGVLLHRYVLPEMAAAAGVGLPAVIMNVYHGAELALLGLAGLVIAVGGALLPAGWAAATRTATALHAE